MSLQSSEGLRGEVESWMARDGKKFLLAESTFFQDKERSGFLFEEKIAEGFKWAVIFLPYQAQFFLSDDEAIAESREEFVMQHGGPENLEFYATHSGEVILLLKESRLSEEIIQQVKDIIEALLDLNFQQIFEVYQVDPTYLEYRDGIDLTEQDLVLDILEAAETNFSEIDGNEDAVAAGAAVVAASLGLL